MELVVVERHAEVVDARQRPLARLDDDVDRAALELREPVPEALPLELLPRDAGLEVHLVLADPPVARDQPEAELAQVARLDVAHVARHQVVVEELHVRRGLCRNTRECAERDGRHMNGSALHHVDLVVSSIERSLPFYRDLLAPLGFHRIGEVEGERGETIWYLSGAGCSLGLREAQSESPGRTTATASACTTSRSRPAPARSSTSEPTGCAPRAPRSRAARRSTRTCRGTTRCSFTIPTASSWKSCTSPA